MIKTLLFLIGIFTFTHAKFLDNDIEGVGRAMVFIKEENNETTFELYGATSKQQPIELIMIEEEFTLYKFVEVPWQLMLIDNEKASIISIKDTIDNLNVMTLYKFKK